MAAVLVTQAAAVVEECRMKPSPSRRQPNTPLRSEPGVLAVRLEETVRLVASPISSRARPQSATRTAAKGEPEASRLAVAATV